MFNRIKTLVMMQLADKLNVSLLKKRSRFLVSIIIRIVILLALSIAVQMLIAAFQSFTYIEITSKVILCIIFITQLISIVSVSFNLSSTLYSSSDNTLLLSLPAKHQEIFLSKLIVYYIYEIRKNIYFLLPLFLGYAMQFSLKYHFGPVYFLNVVLLIFFIPLFPVLIGAVLSIPIVFIVHFLHRHTGVSVMVAVCILFGLFYLIGSFVGQLPPNMRFEDIWQKVIQIFDSGITSINQFALFYQNICNILFAGKNTMAYLMNYGILFAILAGLVLLVIFVSLPTFFHLATHSFETTTKKKYKGNDNRERNIFWVFLRKELKMLFRSGMQIISSFGYLLVLPFLIYTLNIIYRTFKLSEFGQIIIFGVNLLVALILLMASNLSSATAISREGSEFYLMKTAPSNTSKMAWAKVFLNLIISAIVAIGVTICIGSLKVLPMFDVFGIAIVLILVNSGHILWSYEMDLMNPKLHDYQMTQNIDNNVNATRSIILGTVLGFLFAGLSIWLIYDNYITGWLRLILIALGFFLARLYLFINKTKIYFEEIQL